MPDRNPGPVQAGSAIEHGVQKEQPFLAEHAPEGQSLAKRWHARLVIARQPLGISRLTAESAFSESCADGRNGGTPTGERRAPPN
jgi:hypothetical protein